MDDPHLFNETNFPLVFGNIILLIDVGANILENLHRYSDPISRGDFASTFFKKLTSNTGKGCTTLRGDIPAFVMRALILAKMIQTKEGISCTASYLLKFQKGEITDTRSLMKKYINEYLKQWRPPTKRTPIGETFRDSFAMTDNMSIFTGSATSDPSLTSIALSFDVGKAMEEYHDIPNNIDIDILDIDATDDLLCLM